MADAYETIAQSHYASTVDQWTEYCDREDVLILDTETTGLGGSAEVVDLALLDTSGCLRFSQRFMPQGPIDPVASEIHGLTLDTLRESGARSYPYHAAAVKETLDSSKIILGWNVQFDRRMLWQTIKVWGIPQAEIPAPGLVWHDLLADHRRCMAGPHTLTAAVTHLNEALIADGIPADILPDITQAHGAAADCGLVMHLLQRTRGDVPGYAPPAHPSRRQLSYLESLCGMTDEGSVAAVMASRWPERNPDVALSQPEASELIEFLK